LMSYKEHSLLGYCYICEKEK
jgi:hypothetical protein